MKKLLKVFVTEGMMLSIDKEIGFEVFLDFNKIQIIRRSSKEGGGGVKKKVKSVRECCHFLYKPAVKKLVFLPQLYNIHIRQTRIKLTTKFKL